MFIKIFRDYKFEFVLLISMLTILIFSFIRKITNKKGTFSAISKNYNNLNYINNLTRTISNTSPPKNNIPKESKGEIECRRVLYSIFQVPFNKYRPDFLKNHVNGGHNLELDCYNPKLKLAIEYNGIQHYKFSPFFHKNKETFLNQKYRDEIKRRMCKDNDIVLIEVPYTVQLEDIESYIINKLKEIDYYNKNIN
jgi:hypothetical protein